MTNPFSSENLLPQLSNYPISKGGVGSGRYPKGSGVGSFTPDQQRTIMSASPREARESADVLSSQGFVTGEQAQMMSAVHNQLSNDHNVHAQDFFVMENPEAGVFQNPQDTTIGNAHFKADEAHRNASKLWGKVASEGSTPQSLKEAVSASRQAETSSSRADGLENKSFGKSVDEILKGGEGSGRYPKGSGETTTPSVGMSMSEYHYPGGGSAYHHIITSVSPSGHRFEARMVIGGKEAGVALGNQLANAKSQAEREAIISGAITARILSSQADTYVRRRSGEYQPRGTSGAWRPSVTLNSTYTQELWD